MKHLVTALSFLTLLTANSLAYSAPASDTPVANDIEACRQASIEAVKAYAASEGYAYDKPSYATDEGGTFQKDPSVITVTLSDADDVWRGYDIFDVKMAIDGESCKAVSVQHTDAGT